MFKSISFLLFIFTFSISACAGQQRSIIAIATYVPSPKASNAQINLTNISPSDMTPTFVALLTQFAPPPKPNITATPLAFDATSQNLISIIDTLFDHQMCTKTDYLTPVADIDPQYIPNYHIGKPEFNEITGKVDYQKIVIEEIADNTSGSYRAYLVDEPAPTVACADCIQSRVYIQNQSNKRIYKLNWNGYLSSRILGNLLWIDNTILTFYQSIGPHGDELIGVDVEKQEFVYYAGLSCQ